jgi:uncharacterized protein (DUF2249 family)
MWIEKTAGVANAPAHRRARRDGLRLRMVAGPEPELLLQVGVVEVDLVAWGCLPLHAHGETGALLYVVSGRGLLLRGACCEELSPGRVTHLASGLEARITNPGVEKLRLRALFATAGCDRGLLTGSPASGEVAETSERPCVLLDLRGLPRPQRHSTVVATLEALTSGTSLVIVDDHHPDALRRRLGRRHGGRLGWHVRERSDDRVAVDIWLNEPGRPGLGPGPGVRTGDLFPPRPDAARHGGAPHGA